jgi:hypothetical protein
MKKEQLLIFFNKHKQILPLLLLTAYCIDSLITSIQGTVEVVNYQLSLNHYIAFVMVGLSFLSYFFLQQFYKYVLGLTIVAGLFNLIVFPAIQHIYFFSIYNAEIAFQPSAFFTGMLTYIINFKRINQFIVLQFRDKRKLEEIEPEKKIKK